MKKLSKYLLFVSIVTLITILVVVVQRSYDRIMKTQAKIAGDIIIQPINPNLNISVLDEIEKKQDYKVIYDDVSPPVSPASETSQ